MWIEHQVYGPYGGALIAGTVPGEYRIEHWFDSPWGPMPSHTDVRVKYESDGTIQEFSASGKESDQNALYMCSPYLVAIGLMNCRNVTTQRHERLQPVRRKQRRTRPPKLDYHTIVLPRSAEGGYTGQGVDGGNAPQHHVRGHFKTYTPEAPLMGKHIGTYWWGWQVRGKKRNGITVTDYQV